MATKFITPSWRMPKNSNQSKASNYSLDFDGTNNYILTDLTPDSYTGFSISAWVYADSLGSYNVVASQYRDNNPSNSAWFLETIGSNMAFGVVNGTTLKYAQKAFSTLGWYHVVGVWDGSTVEVYIDGAASGSPQSISAMNTGTVNMAIGGLWNNGGTAVDNGFWNGKIGPVSIFDYALSTGSISALYNDGIPSNPLAVTKPPIAFYDLGQGSAYAEGSAGIVEPNLAAATGSTVFNFNNNPSITFSDDFFTPSGTVGGDGNFMQVCSISWWVKSNRAGSYSVIIPLSSTNYWALRIGPVGNMWFIAGSGGNYVKFNNVTANSINLYDNEWHHCMFTIPNDNNKNECRFFIDNQEITNTTTAGVTTGAGNNAIMSRLHLGGGILGNIEGTETSNLQVWLDTALNDTDIAKVYNNGTPLQSNIPQSDSLKAWYKLGLDTSTWNGNDWIIGNSTANYTTALNWPGVNGANYVDLSTGVQTALGASCTEVTLAGWFNITDITRNQGLFGFTQNGNYGRIQVAYNYNGGSPVIQFRMNTTWYQYGSFTPGSKWHHVAVVYDASDATPTLKAYLNGSPLSISADPSGWPASLDFTTAGQFHRVGWNVSNTAAAAANISNYGVWSSALTAGNIETLYNNGTPEENVSFSPVGYYKLDNTTTGIQNTGSASSADGTISGNVTQVDSFVSTLNGTSDGMNTANLVPSNLIKSIPYSGYSMDFDGTLDYITTSLDISNSSFTTSVWVKANSSGYASGGKYVPFNVQSDDTNGVNRSINQLYNGGGGGGTGLRPAMQTYEFGTNNFQYWFASDNNFLDGRWYNVVWTRDSSNSKIQCYVNGQLQTFTQFNSAGTTTALTDYGTNPSTPRSYSNVTIGAFKNHAGTISNNYLGKVSNCSIFNRVLSEDEILRVYNGGSPSDLTNLNPTGWWSLGADSYFNGSDWICPDLSTNNNNGTSVDMGAANLLGDGPDSLANGTSTNLDLATDLIGEAPGSTGNAISINMNSLARTGSTP